MQSKNTRWNSRVGQGGQGQGQGGGQGQAQQARQGKEGKSNWVYSIKEHTMAPKRKTSRNELLIMVEVEYGEFKESCPNRGGPSQPQSFISTVQLTRPKNVNSGKNSETGEGGVLKFPNNPIFVPRGGSWKMEPELNVELEVGSILLQLSVRQLHGDNHHLEELKVSFC